MNYYGRCVNRINNANKIELKYNSNYMLSKTVIIDSDLEAIQVDYPNELERPTTYIIIFKKIKVPLTIAESESIFNTAILRMEHLEELQNQEILKDL